MRHAAVQGAQLREAPRGFFWGLERALRWRDRIRSGERAMNSGCRFTPNEILLESRPIWSSSPCWPAEWVGSRAAVIFSECSVLLTACSAHPLWWRTSNSEIKRWFSFALNFGFMISPLTSYKGLLTDVYLIDCVPLLPILHTTTKVIFPKYTLDSFFILKALLINPSSSHNRVQTPWHRRPFKTGLLQTSLHLLLFSFPFQIIFVILIIIIITTTVISIFIMLNFFI